MLHAIADFDHETETLSRELGEPFDHVKSEWLAAVVFTAHGQVGAELSPQRSMDDMHGDCTHISWNMSREMELWQRPEIAVRGVHSRARPRCAARRSRGSDARTPWPGPVRRAAGQGSWVGQHFPGLVVFTPPAEGVCRASAGHSVWIDAVVSGKIVPSELFEMQTGCPTIFKRVAFAFRAGEPAILQLGGSPLDSVALLVTRWSD